MTHPIRKNQWISATLLVAILIQPLTALAQLEEVIVTAERREASVQDVPLSVSAYGAEALEKLQIEDTLDLINVVPNLFGGNNTGLGTANMYYLRGQGNDESIATFDPAVGTYVDDVYVTRQNANNFTLFDVDRIEVLRGPQGTLFGRNTTGGAINVILKRPGEEFGGYAAAGYGRYNEWMGRASVDIPFSENVLSKFSAFVIHDDGWLDNIVVNDTFNDNDTFGFHGALRFLGADDLIWDVSVDYIDSKVANIWGAIVGDDRISTSVLPLGLPPQFNQKAAYGNDTKTLSLISNLSWEAFGGQTNFIVGYRDLDQEFLLNFPNATDEDFFWIDNDGEHSMLTGELKWNAELWDGKVNFVTGLYYLDEDNTTDFADYLFGFLQLADRTLANTTKSWAYYAQADISVGEKGTFTIGARYTDETKKIGLADNTGRGILTTANLIAAGIPTKITESNVTPRFAYAYQFQEDLMGYISATKGFKSGGWNARGTTAAAFAPFGPETIWSYELGMRAEWLDNRLRTNATVFFSDLKDLQTTSATQDGQFLTTNAGGLEVPGFELELTAVPNDYWEIFLTIGLQDPKYVDLPSGCTVPNTTYAAYDVNCNPATPKRAPKQTYTLGTSFTIPMSWGASLQPFASARYIGKNVVGTRSTGVNDAVTLFNAGISLVADNQDWMATLECNNCFDEEYTTSYLFVDYPTPPGTWQIRFQYNFGN